MGRHVVVLCQAFSRTLIGDFDTCDVTALYTRTVLKNIGSCLLEKTVVKIRSSHLFHLQMMFLNQSIPHLLDETVSYKWMHILKCVLILGLIKSTKFRNCKLWLH